MGRDSSQARPGRVLSKPELLDAVWPGVIVTDDSLSQCVNELRAALGESGQRLLKTVPRRGYMLDATVRVEARPAAPARSESAPAPHAEGAAPLPIMGVRSVEQAGGRSALLTLAGALLACAVLVL